MLDVALATLFVFPFIAEASLTSKEMASWKELQEDALPQAPTRARIRWLIRYLALAAALVALMVLQAPYLPKAIH